MDWSEIRPSGRDSNFRHLDIALSTLGDKIVAADSYDSSISFSGSAYISTDGGESWSDIWPYAGAKWRTLTISDDGQHILAGASYGGLYLATDGETLQQIYPGDSNPHAWSGAAMTPDGRIMVVCAEYGKVYRSEDYGENWSELVPTGVSTLNYWVDLVMDSTGEKIAICSRYGGNIYLSTDGGQNWSAAAI
ncbi:MAG: hypothetical protein QUT30_05730 [Acidobacteriota bacterium]|nr:hypothetical protein [Acidobacteriota bacterium]